jgi:hypothetical protein
VDQGALIGIAIVVAVLFGKPLVNGLRSGYTFVKSRVPKLSSPAGLFTAKVEIEYWTVAALLVAFLLISGGGFKLPSLPTWKLPGWPSLVSKPDAVTYVHEQRSGSINPGIRAGLSTLNEKGIVATEFDADTVNREGGSVPKQYVVPLAAAKKVGLPAVVSTAGDRVLKTIKDPNGVDIRALAP